MREVVRYIKLLSCSSCCFHQRLFTSKYARASTHRIGSVIPILWSNSFPQATQKTCMSATVALNLGYYGHVT